MFKLCQQSNRLLNVNTKMQISVIFGHSDIKCGKYRKYLFRNIGQYITVNSCGDIILSENISFVVLIFFSSASSGWLKGNQLIIVEYPIV